MSIVITDVIERSGITFLYRKVPILDQYGKSILTVWNNRYNVHVVMQAA